MTALRGFPPIGRTTLARSLAGVVIVGNFLLNATALAGSTADNSGVPALLQFAEQYNQQNLRQLSSTLPAQQKGASKSKTPPGELSAEKKQKAPALRWQTKEAELHRQRATISQLEKQIGLLQKSLAETPAVKPPVPSLDMKGLSQLAQGVRQALAVTPKEQQALASLKQLQQQADQAELAVQELKNHNALLQKQVGTLQTELTANKSQSIQQVGKERATLNSQLQAMKEDKATLQAHLATAQKDYQVLDVSNENVKKQLVSAKERDGQQQQQQEELKRQRVALQSEVDTQVAAVATLRAEVTALQAQAPAQFDKATLKKPSGRQDYAAGVSLGEEILQMQAERQRWGVNTDKQTILAGIIDTFAGQRQLGDDELNQALIASESRVTRAREKTIAEQAKKGESYLATFKKGKAVKSTAAGAWYRVDYAGDAPIPEGASLDVVVKETLTNGTVIQDMEAKGAVLTQTLDKFPPLFQEALKTLRNHGSLTLVVPPELAYGDKGYPPNVPPNATMVYTLRVAEIYPQVKQPKASVAVKAEKTAD